MFRYETTFRRRERHTVIFSVTSSVLSLRGSFPLLPLYSPRVT